MIHFGVQLKEKPLHPPSASVGSFYFYPSLEQAQLGLKIKIPGASRQGFFLVDKRFEISNLDIIRDMKEIIILRESLAFL